MSYWIIFGIVLFATVAMTVREGLWSNTLTLVNIIISGLVAFGFYAPLVVYLDESVTDGQHTYWLDFAVLWALFAVAMVVCRALTGAFSKTRMRFKYPIDDVGGPAGRSHRRVRISLVYAGYVSRGSDAEGHSGRQAGIRGCRISLRQSVNRMPLGSSFSPSVSDPEALGSGSTSRFSGNIC